ncbi:MAG: Lon-like protease helical domain-containing protein, partial [Planctomycetota bacterium]
MAKPLSPDSYRRTCKTELFEVRDSRELPTLEDALGQDRAVEALRFGLGIHHRGYGLFVLGPTGTGRHDMVRKYLERRAATQPTPMDWCYVNNFKDPQKPRALKLPSGVGTRLRKDMAELMDELQAAIPAAFESEDYRTRRRTIEAEFKERHEKAFAELSLRAEARNIALVRTPDGLALAPMRDGEVLGSDELDAIPAKERKQIDRDLDQLGRELQQLVHKAPKWAQEQRERLRKLDREITSLAVSHLIDALRKEYDAMPDALEYFHDVQADVLERANQFIKEDS